MRALTMPIGELIILIFEIFACFIISVASDSDIKYPICILPIVFCLGHLLMSIYAKSWTKNIATVVFVGGFFVKLYIYPLCVLLFGLGDYASMAATNKIDEAVALQCYEFAVLIFASIHFTRKYPTNDSYSNNDKIYEGNDLYFGRKYRKIIFVLSIISLVIIVSYSSLLYRFRYVYIGSQAMLNQWYSNLHSVSKVPLLISEFGFWLIEIDKILVIYLIIVSVKYKFHRLSNFTKIFFSLVATLSLILITTNDRAGSFIAGFAMLITIIRLYPKHRAFLTKLFVFSIAFIAVLIIFVLPIMTGGTSYMYGSTSDPSYITRKINAYFGGAVNVSAALNMPRKACGDYLMSDIFGAVPMVRYLNKKPMSYILFNKLLGIDVRSQITPAIGQAKFYLGFILSPILQLITLKVALQNQLYATNANNSYSFFVYQYMSIFTSLGLTLYYFTLTLYLVLKFVFPMMVILIVFNKRNMNYEKDFDLYK